MSRVAILCPTRGRLDHFTRLCEKVAETSNATVLAYIDEDDSTYYNRTWPNAILDGGKQIEITGAMNALAHRHREFDIYGMLPDDSYPTIPGWDDYLIEQLGDPTKPRALFPPHNCGDYHDLAFVNRVWIDACGWYAVPQAVHFAWPTAISLLATGSQKDIDGDPARIFIHHDMQAGPSREVEREDARNFHYWTILGRMPIIHRLRGMP